MYYCKNCRKEFEFAKIYFEKQGENAFEKFLLCPYCDSTDFFEQKGCYCRYCGVRLRVRGREYCSYSCRKKGEELFAKELKRNERNKADILTNAIKEVDAYNKRTNCRLSYGQYFALKGVGRI